MKLRLCHPVICCGTYWTPLNTVLMQGKKPQCFDCFGFQLSRKMNSELWWSLLGVKHPSSWGCPCEGPSSPSHRLNPVGPVDAGRHCSLANVYFMWKTEKKEERTLWIWRSKPLFKGFVHFVSRACDLGPHRSYAFEMHWGGLMFMWNSFDKARQMQVRKVNEPKSPSMKLSSLLTQQLWGNTSNLDGHLTRAPSNFHRCN